MKAFKAYDIRGVYNTDFNKADVYKIGFFLVELLQADKVLLGRDARLSSPEIYEALVQGITDAGSDVHDAGLCTTPMIYWGTGHYDFSASVMITASHNPAAYNGLKISGKGVLPIGYDNGLQQLESMLEQGSIQPSAHKGQVIKLDYHEAYLSFIQSYVKDFSNLNIAVDASNGMAGLFIKNLMPAHTRYIFDDINGSFPNHEANPLEAENRVQIEALVKETGADVGVIFDGDADRVMFLDENGRFVSPDLIIALLAHHFLEQQPSNRRVLHDIRTSKAVGEYLSTFGADVHMWRVGRAYAARKLKEIDGLFGGELAGHYYFKDFYYSDSGLLAAVLVLNVLGKLKREGISFAQLMQRIEKYQNSGEINFKIEAKQAAMDAVIAHFEQHEGKPTAFYDFDGYRMEYADWWINIRPSNTEPYLRFLAEARSPQQLKKLVDTVTDIIQDVE